MLMMMVLVVLVVLVIETAMVRCAFRCCGES